MREGALLAEDAVALGEVAGGGEGLDAAVAGDDLTARGASTASAVSSRGGTAGGNHRVAPTATDALTSSPAMMTMAMTTTPADVDVAGNEGVGRHPPSRIEWDSAVTAIKKSSSEKFFEPPLSLWLPAAVPPRPPPNRRPDRNPLTLSTSCEVSVGASVSSLAEKRRHPRHRCLWILFVCLRRQFWGE